jgi:hypothetical protein
MAKYEVIRSNVVFGTLIFMFIAMILFVFLVAPEVREEILPEYVVSYEKTVFDVSPGELNSGTITEGTKYISLNDITVDNTIQQNEIDVVRDAAFSASIFSNDVYNFGFSVDKSSLQSASLKFLVYDLSGDGKVKIYLNGKSVLARTVDLGSQIVVDFPLTYIRDGANQVEITASTPSVTFWRKNSITLLDITLLTEEYGTRKSVSNQIFSLSSSEAANADDAVLKAFIYAKGEPANIDIMLNGNRILKALPPQNLEIDIPTAYLKSGANLFEWSVEQDGQYLIKFTNILIDTVKTTGRETTYFFSISDDVYKKAKSGEYDCILYLKRFSGDDVIIMEINSEVDKYTFMGNDVSIDICDNLDEGKNEIKFSAENELKLEQATLRIKNKE